MINMLLNGARNLELLAKSLVLPAGEHRDGKQAGRLVTRPLGTVKGGQLSLPESGGASRGVHGDQVCAKTRGLAAGRCHGGRNVVKFQVKEDALAETTQGCNDLRPSGHKQLQAHLHPQELRNGLAELQGGLRIQPIKGNDDAIR